MDFQEVYTPHSDSRVSYRRRVFHIPVMEEIVAPGPAFLIPQEEGTHEVVEVPPEELGAIREELNQPKFQLSEWLATAVSGNDIMSSVMYSAGIVVVKGGKLAPIAFALVSVVLYLFRFIYTEAVMAIPLNGGSYNLLLNTTSKRMAAIAACLSTLCYLATAVVSATTACYYFQASVPSLPVIETTIGLLGAFALLMIIGIKESSMTAFAIFSFHILTLTVLAVVCFIYMVQHPDIIKNNYTNTTYPAVDFAGTMIDGNVFTALFFGFAVAMLGVTGFETSANFVEEQKPGVFPKTLRNMWMMASVYNVFLCIMGLSVLTIDDIVAHQNAVLARQALVAGGSWMQWWVSVDAFIVLSGGVLTSYVGITGLFRRLAADRVVPEFFGHRNKWRQTNHWIVIFFFIVATSLVLILNADATTLGGVYTYSFLSLMFLFGSGCILLKLKRQDIPREVQAPWYACIIGMILVLCGIIGNLLGDPKTLMYFALYFIFVATIVFTMLERVFVLRLLIAFVNLFVRDKKSTNEAAPQSTEMKVPFQKQHEREGDHVAMLVRSIKEVNRKPIVFFAKQASLTTLNKAILYVRRNEITSNLWIIHVYNDESLETMEAIDAMREMVGLLDTLYPKLKTDFYAIKGPFEPATVEWISKTYNIPTNMMFIKAPSTISVHRISSFGVRVITG